MHRYTVLLKFTEQGVKKINKSISRARDFKKLAAKNGVKIESQFWLVGRFDGLLVLSGEREEKILQIIASLVALGNIRTETLRALDEKEFGAIAG
jgi:uncharacterized protein with GYD domain